ncbi:excinuclease ABC subunit UvrC [Phragmitibacter flavus]|uniref:Excinuclease ABC subunit UvrC n=1 Tax=Phragmitibacter flavus TaxID=2576071 RepID=A0A5R8KCZ9_9BACT|nr:excinuclease ABC subunit UvrC [Phragmitibacter flavus]TLD69469.1 excinuclease ABC subunit UvrC [Phragmitibacter flavus]
MSLRREKPDLNARLHDVPHQPGVYVMRDRFGKVIYVGKARDLRKRLSNYFTPSRARHSDTKTRALIESIWDFEFHTVRNEGESLILEMRLIKDFRPKYNVSFKDDKRYLLVKVQPADPFPRFSLTRLKKDDNARYFGPFAHSGALRTTLNWMNREFGLRVCRPANPDANDYKHCHNDIIKNCSAPCIARVTPDEYRIRISQACDFLDGKSKGLLNAIEEEMKKAAAKLDFERAAELRDMFEHLQKTLKPMRTFERAPHLRLASTIDPMADVKELQEYLGLERPPLVMECFDIANIGTAHCVASMVRFKNGVSDNAKYRRYRIRIVDGQNDFLAMSEVVQRRYSRVLLEARDQLGAEAAEFTQENPLDALRRLESEHPEIESEIVSKNPKWVSLPDLVIIDGGKGQLGVAVAQLNKLGLHDLPVIGLAKQEEEVYRPGIEEPIRIPHDRGALKLLQRIRDEAHRWANGYHQLLLKRRVAESILDDCTGISQARRTTLLRAFGSVARLRKASVEDIAKLPGISKTLAQDILKFLDDRSS